MDISADPQPTKPNIGKPVLFGMFIVIVFIGGLLTWSTMAPLESAAIAPGKVTVDTNRKTIQHLEGGIVKEILIEEGDMVKKHQTLILLETTQAKASVDLIQGKLNALRAKEARFLSEKNNLEQVEFPAELLMQSYQKNIQSIIEGEVALFNSRRLSLSTKIDVIAQRNKQFSQEIASYQALANASDEQLNLLNEELEAVAFLEKQKFIDRPRLLALKREAARLLGDRDEQLALAARAQQQIVESESQLIDLKTEYLKEVLENLRATQEEIAETEQRHTAATDTLNRTTVRAPLDGEVINLLAHTTGGVISPGAPIMDIVPSHDNLVVEARVNPLDIDVVRRGLLAKVQFTAYKSRHTPTVDGIVTRISADSLTDNQTGMSYYMARIVVSKEQLDRLGGVDLTPGMPAQVMIITESRTAFDYIITPLVDSFDRAFREE